MIVSRLELKSFRNYHAVSVDFDKKMNVIIGPNGAGKTNIVEAIDYLSLARSFRASNDAELIERGEPFAVIDATVREGELSHKLKIVLSGEGKKISCNGHKITKLSELSEMMNVIVFEPKDVLMFQDLPKTRRRFLDISLSKQASAYLDFVSQYEKAIRERNELLRAEKPNLLRLEAITESLIKLAEPIDRYRVRYVAQINDVLGKIVQSIKGDGENIAVVYTPFVAPGPGYQKAAKEAYGKSLETDLRRRVTNIGPHREDFSMTLNGNDIAAYGSQGENRLLVLALKLSPYFLVQNKDKRPIIVLDDVLSELDANHSEKLINFLERFEQVFITATKYDRSGASVYEVADHKISRRKSL